MDCYLRWWRRNTNMRVWGNFWRAELVIITQVYWSAVLYTAYDFLLNVWDWESKRSCHWPKLTELPKVTARPFLFLLKNSPVTTKHKGNCLLWAQWSRNTDTFSSDIFFMKTWDQVAINIHYHFVVCIHVKQHSSHDDYKIKIINWKTLRMLYIL